MAKSKLVSANKKIEKAVVGGYKKIEESVVGGYKKIEKGAVDGFTKISDGFVDQFLTRDGETVEDAKERLKAEQEEREEHKVTEEGQDNTIAEASLANAKRISGDAKRKAGL